MGIEWRGVEWGEANAKAGKTTACPELTGRSKTLLMLCYQETREHQEYAYSYKTDDGTRGDSVALNSFDPGFLRLPKLKQLRFRKMKRTKTPYGSSAIRTTGTTGYTITSDHIAPVQGLFCSTAYIAVSRV